MSFKVTLGRLYHTEYRSWRMRG